jgi:uncharacterized membrane protein
VSDARDSRESHPNGSTVQENVEAIKAWDQALLHKRSGTELLSDWITSVAASGPCMLLHVVWFAGWIAINTGLVPMVTPFDEFPFPLLTMIVSLEAIFLALFVLASQNRLAKQSDKRSNLDLQIDLLAEREMTAVLQLLRDIAEHLHVKETVTREQLSELAKKTDINALAREVDR